MITVECNKCKANMPEPKMKEERIELYSDVKDWDNEKKVEDILEKYGIAYQKTGEYLESEKMYEVLYEMEV